LKRLEALFLRASAEPPEFAVVFCSARDGRPAGTSVCGTDGRLVWLEPPGGCQQGELVRDEDEPVTDGGAA
jgi:hypothetical protein